LYNNPKDLSDEEKKYLSDYLESRKRRNTQWVWLREQMVKSKLLPTKRV
jgi:hypothetical protein